MGFKNLETYISELLYRYNIVVLPGLGAFIGRRKPAMVDKTEGIFQPPSKEISFNVLIRKDDGLLINHVASKEHVTKEKARDFVQQEISAWKNELNRTKNLRLENIGFFNLIDDKIIFTPHTGINHLPEAFGLNDFIHKPEKQVLLNTEYSSEQKEFSEPFPTPVSSIGSTTPGRRQDGSHKWIKYAAAAAIAISLLWGGYHLKDNFYSHREVRIQQATYQIPDKFPEIIIPLEQDQTHQTTEKNNTDKSYHIIIGAFKNYNNATRLVENLKAQGIDASIPGQNPNGLYYVSFTSFTNKSQAEILAKRIGSEYPGAWVLEK